MEDEVVRIVSEALGISRSRVTEKLEYQSIPEWDSMGHVKLMVALESAFDLEIDEDTMVELTSVSAIQGFLSQR